MAYVVEGEFNFVIGDQTTSAPTGSFAFIPRGLVHTVSEAGSGGRLIYMFSPSGMEGAFKEIDRVTDMARIGAAMAKAGMEFAGPPPG